MYSKEEPLFDFVFSKFVRGQDLPAQLARPSERERERERSA